MANSVIVAATMMAGRCEETEVGRRWVGEKSWKGKGRLCTWLASRHDTPGTTSFTPSAFTHTVPPASIDDEGVWRGILAVDQTQPRKKLGRFAGPWKSRRRRTGPHKSRRSAAQGQQQPSSQQQRSTRALCLVTLSYSQRKGMIRGDNRRLFGLCHCCSRETLAPPRKCTHRSLPD
jgi:hypothetical protein